jgi:hypothetical protein
VTTQLQLVLIIINKDREILCSPKNSSLQALGYTLLFNGTRVIFPALRRPTAEAGHSPPLSAEVKNFWDYTYVTSRRGQGKRNFL